MRGPFAQTGSAGPPHSLQTPLMKNRDDLAGGGTGDCGLSGVVSGGSEISPCLFGVSAHLGRIIVLRRIGAGHSRFHSVLTVTCPWRASSGGRRPSQAARTSPGAPRDSAALQSPKRRRRSAEQAGNPCTNLSATTWPGHGKTPPGRPQSPASPPARSSLFLTKGGLKRVWRLCRPCLSETAPLGEKQGRPDPRKGRDL